MGMDTPQQQMIDSRFRQLFQRYYEFGVIRRQLRRHAIDLTGKVLLDAGCASGYSTHVIASLFEPGALYAFDVMPEQVARAQARQLDATVFVGDIAAIDLAADTVDAVFTFGVFHHVPDWPRAIREVRRVLKPGGVLLGGELNKKAPNAFTWPAFRQELVNGGFEILEQQKIYFGFFRSFLCRSKGIRAKET